MSELDDHLARIAKIVRPLTMLEEDRLFYLLELAVSLPVGDMVACGVCHGGDVIAFYKAFEAKGQKRNIIAIDSFRGASPPTPGKDDRPDRKGRLEAGTHDVGGIAHFWANLSVFGIYPGHVAACEMWVTEETLKAIPHRPLAFLWVDVNGYQPTLDALRYFGPDMVKGGAIVVDDYEFGFCHGIKPAIEESGFGPWEFPKTGKHNDCKLAIWRK